MWHLPYKEGIANDYISTNWFTIEYEKRSGEKVPGVKELAERYPGNAGVRMLFTEFGHHLGEIIAPWLTAIAADMSATAAIPLPINIHGRLLWLSIFSRSRVVPKHSPPSRTGACAHSRLVPDA